MKSRLVEQLSEARDLLQTCGWEEEARWFGVKAESLLSLDPLSHAFQQDVQEISKILAGIGSFSDIPLRPIEGSNLSEEDATRAQWRLGEEIWQSCKALLLNGGK